MSRDIKKLISEMTLDEKISLLSGADFWHTKAVERFDIPAVMMCDGPNGLRKQDDKADHLGINQSIKAVCFPTSSAIAASFDRNLAREVGETLGKECRTEHVSMLLGPGVNIKRSPLCGRNFEYYSEDPYLSTELATEYIEGVQEQGVASCMKHFAANNQETRRMNGNSIVDERTLHEIYLASFEGAVKKAKPMSIMCAYNRLNGSYGSENAFINNEILRKKWGFDGFVVTDWGAIKDRVKGVNAGIDLEMPGPVAPEKDEKTKQAVLDGTISGKTLDTAVERLLTWIFKTTENAGQKGKIDLEEGYRKAVWAEKNCAVLLKNENVLPLKKGSKTAIIGGFVEKPRYQGGGSSHINSAYVPSMYDLIKDADEICYAKGFELAVDEVDENLEQEALKLAADCENIVILAGLPDRFETEGVDRKHLEIPKNQNHLISVLAENHKNVVVVLHNGSPVEMPWVDEVSAILEMYLGGDGVSEATLSILYGETNPSGKLAETFPLKLSDNPSYLFFPGEEGVVEYREGIFVGYRYYDKKNLDVLFPFGHGLSYTEFEYSDLKVSETSLKEGEELTVSFQLKNTGKVAGAEAVQLYIGALDSKVIRPEKELKGFEKLFLEPGESKKVSFKIGKKELSYYETKLSDWFAATGKYAIYIGSSSRDSRLQTEIDYEAVTLIPMSITADTSLGDLQGNPKAQALFASMQSFTSQASEVDMEALGESGGELAAAMMVEMPLGSLVSFGVMTEEQLQGILMMLNE